MATLPSATRQDQRLRLVGMLCSNSVCMSGARLLSLQAGRLVLQVFLVPRGRRNVLMRS